MKNTLKY